jgi:hypothetical protein
MIFYEDFPGSRIWIGQKEIDLNPMKTRKGRSAYAQVFFDQVSGRLWVWNRQKNDNESFFIADITGGDYIPENEIILYPPDNEQPVNIYANNNTALVEYSSKLDYAINNGLYGFVDLGTAKQEIIDIRNVLKKLGSLLFIIGFDEESILYNKGYYNMKEGKFSEYTYNTNLFFPYYNINKQKIIGIDEKNNTIIEYEPGTGSYKEIISKKSKLSLNNFCGIYIEDNILYIAKTSFRSNFNFISQPPQREWFKYDINTGNRIRIYVPSEYVKILGRRNN